MIAILELLFLLRQIQEVVFSVLPINFKLIYSNSVFKGFAMPLIYNFNLCPATKIIKQNEAELNAVKNN